MWRCRGQCLAIAALSCLVLLGSGCGDGAPSHEDYMPSSEKAKAALEKALAAWQEGREPGKLETASGMIQVIDFQWQEGKKLKSYEILGPEPGNDPPKFNVRLELQDTIGVTQARYVLVGINPLWVYREEDYHRAIGMN